MKCLQTKLQGGSWSGPVNASVIRKATVHVAGIATRVETVVIHLPKYCKHRRLITSKDSRYYAQLLQKWSEKYHKSTPFITIHSELVMLRKGCLRIHKVRDGTKTRLLCHGFSPCTTSFWFCCVENLPRICTLFRRMLVIHNTHIIYIYK